MFQRKRLQQMYCAHNPVTLRKMPERCSEPRLASAQVANQMPFESRERARMLATTSSSDRLKFQLNRLQQTDSENCCIM